MPDEDKEQEQAEAIPADNRSPDDEPDDPEALRARLAEEKDKAQSYLANWQRAAADFQNFKRRVEQERQDSGRLATASLVMNLLPVVDDLERALNSVDVHLAGLTWLDGIWLIYRKLQMVLERAGVTEIEADGRQFDPAVHEAISQAEGEEGKVIAVAQKGYKLGDRVLRPSMVIVGRGKSEPSSPPAGSGETGGSADPQQ